MIAKPDRTPPPESPPAMRIGGSAQPQPPLRIHHMYCGVFTTAVGILCAAVMINITISQYCNIIYCVEVMIMQANRLPCVSASGSSILRPPLYHVAINNIYNNIYNINNNIYK